MIKLIASDMDGTLLQNGVRVISEAQMNMVRELIEGGVIFAPASGRQCANLRRCFEPVADELVYIAENGSLVKYKDEILFKASMDKKIAVDIMEDIYKTQGCEILLSGEDTSYLLPKTDSYVKHMTEYVKNNVTVIKSFDDVKEDFIKVSVFNPDGIAAHKDYFYNRWSEFVQVSVSGPCWQDFVPMGVHKGNAIKAIQKRFDIKREETMVFGDNYNDLEMFDEAFYSYCMTSAAEDVKKRARFTADTVLEVLKDWKQNPVFGRI